MKNISVFSEYRNEATDGYCYSDLSEYGYDDDEEVLVPKSTVINAIDGIESDVNEIIKLLEDISGIEIIDEVKEKLKTLSEKLY